MQLTPLIPSGLEVVTALLLLPLGDYVDLYDIPL